MTLARAHIKKLSINRHRQEGTSITIEPSFLAVLAEEAAARGMSVSNLVCMISEERDRKSQPNLSSSVRVWILEQVRLERDQYRAELARVRGDQSDPPFAMPVDP